jgi:hypothetical protein
LSDARIGDDGDRFADEDREAELLADVRERWPGHVPLAEKAARHATDGALSRSLGPNEQTDFL